MRPIRGGLPAALKRTTPPAALNWTAPPAAFNRTALVLIGLTALIALSVLTPAPAYADSIRDGMWHLRSLKIADAHLRANGNGVTVAVVDSGVDATHPDLVRNVLPGLSVFGGDEQARFDPDGRGTGLAGLIAGHGHGDLDADGVLGIAPMAKILPVAATTATVASPVRSDDPDAIARGIELATQHRASVICVSRGVADTPRLRDAVRTARRSDIVVVAAASDRPGAAFSRFPAFYDGVLAAEPTSRNPPSRSPTTGPSSERRPLVIGTPGEDLESTNTGGGYRIDSGAMAAGVLAGAVALVRAAYPSLPADEVVHRITATVTDSGQLDLLAALTRVVPALRPSASATRPAAAGPVAGPDQPAPRRRGPFGWLVVLPTLAVIGGLIWYAVRAERTTPPVHSP